MPEKLALSAHGDRHGVPMASNLGTGHSGDIQAIWEWVAVIS